MPISKANRKTAVATATVIAGRGRPGDRVVAADRGDRADRRAGIAAHAGPEGRVRIVADRASSMVLRAGTSAAADRRAEIAGRSTAAGGPGRVTAGRVPSR
jgi:hypothetical protein